MTFATRAELESEVPAADLLHFMQCSECTKWFDMRSLDDTMFHGLGHFEARDIPSDAPGRRVN